MLLSLHIENIAIIDKSDIDFHDGFNVLTGETGAGKSIIIDSINAILGEKTSREGLETGLMVGATVTSTASTITSAISLSKMDELIKKVKSCNKHIKEIAPIADDLLDEEVDPDDKIIYQVGKIKSACTGFDEQNIESIKGQLIGTTITSGVGAASGIVGTVAKGIGNKNADEEVKNKADLASKIATGITTATSATGVILSSTTLAGLNKNKDTADKCEKTLMQY